jgi:hypothetical protein
MTGTSSVMTVRVVPTKRPYLSACGAKTPGGAQRRMNSQAIEKTDSGETADCAEASDS